MNKKLIEELEQKLKKEKATTEKTLAKFAKKDENVKGDWDTRFPKFDGGESGSGAMEKAADEVTEYGNLLPIEHNLEIKLKSINSALEKIQNPTVPTQGEYGKCEKCGQEIEEEKLKISPETKLCLKCQEK